MASRFSNALSVSNKKNHGDVFIRLSEEIRGPGAIEIVRDAERNAAPALAGHI